jgi:hypothetical protein
MLGKKMKKKNNAYLMQSALYSMIASISPVLGGSLSEDHSDHYTNSFGPEAQSGDTFLQETAASVSDVRATIKKEVDDRNFPDELHDLIIASLTSNPNAIQHIESFHENNGRNDELDSFLDKMKTWIDKHYIQDKKKTTDTLNAEIHIQYPQWKDDLQPYSLPSVVKEDISKPSLSRDQISLTTEGLTYSEDLKLTVAGKNLPGKTGMLKLTKYKSPVTGYTLAAGETELSPTSFEMPKDGLLTLKYLDAGTYEAVLTVENLSTTTEITIVQKN